MLCYEDVDRTVRRMLKENRERDIPVFIMMCGGWYVDKFKTYVLAVKHTQKHPMNSVLVCQLNELNGKVVLSWTPEGVSPLVISWRKN